jgi:DNA-binding NtrC family response regulator
MHLFLTHICIPHLLYIIKNDIMIVNMLVKLFLLQYMCHKNPWGGDYMENEKGHILLVDDDKAMTAMLKKILERKCRCCADTASSGMEAIQLISQNRYDAIVTDVRMPDIDGIELLRIAQKKDPSISIVVMTGYGTVDLAVTAVKSGAYDFIEKPFDNERIIISTQRAIEYTRLLRKHNDLIKQIDFSGDFHGFIGTSPPMQRVYELIERVAGTDVTVLIRGESGTGKELAARAIHNLSPRSGKKIVTVNCPALPANILESEMFGYRKGAFTGASRDKKGLFLSAHKSSILLDEIGDLPIELQTKLLRVLQEGEIRPLGQSANVKIDVRVIASTNQPLEEKIKSGDFREDLFYRLNVVTINMPALREIPEDIEKIARHFLDKYAAKYKEEGLAFSPSAMNYIINHSWPGNVRELQNAVKRAVILKKGKIIELEDIQPSSISSEEEETCNETSRVLHLPYKEAKQKVLMAFTTSYLNHVLKSTNGNVTAAAKKIGLERQALQRIIRRYGIKPANFRNKK